MTIPGPGLDNALAGAVRWIEGNLLVDTIRVALPGTGEPVFNPDTGQVEYPSDTVLYAGPGAVLPATAQGDLVAIADTNLPWRPETKSRYRLLTPLDAPDLPKDAQVTVIAVHNPTRTGLIGRSWTCTDVTAASTVQAVKSTPLDQNRAGSTP
ncbi:DUF6093 family protein [Streptomyces sp. WAC08241]|uniref:DUF6093 family protein n=1 Tax=Streptomyces sp. WAC08241 TaxID=2487421 RepID=UPI000F77D65A|nr:DUF6093 family protein [Streptomyces sp. WAC08241]RSS43824.1 hypothetical protein EF906_08730 [Streptomyces sp. WAC08241]